MFRKVIISVTLLCLIVCMQGCYSNYAIVIEKLEQRQDHKNMTIVTIDGEVYEFNSLYVYDDYIEGYACDTTLVRIPIEKVQSARILGFDLTKTGWYTFGIMSFVCVVFIIVLALTWEGMFND